MLGAAPAAEHLPTQPERPQLGAPCLTGEAGSICLSLESRPRLNAAPGLAHGVPSRLARPRGRCSPVSCVAVKTGASDASENTNDDPCAAAPPGRHPRLPRSQYLGAVASGPIGGPPGLKEVFEAAWRRQPEAQALELRRDAARAQLRGCRSGRYRKAKPPAPY